jgi:hypothetical protein
MTGRGYYDRSGKYHRPGSASRYGGWWTYAAGRPSNGIGIGLELPPGRAIAYNVIGLIWLTAGGVLAYRWVSLPCTCLPLPRCLWWLSSYPSLS